MYFTGIVSISFVLTLHLIGGGDRIRKERPLNYQLAFSSGADVMGMAAARPRARLDTEFDVDSCHTAAPLL